MKMIVRKLMLFGLIQFCTFQIFGQYPSFDSLVSTYSDLPVRFDLRDSKRISPVRVQAPGGCWAAAAMSSFESFIQTATGNSFTFSDKNLYHFHGYDSTRTTYGNHMMATAYFVRGDGPFVSTPEVDTLRQSNPPDLIINGARFLPNNPRIIKNTIYQFGGVSTMLRFRPETMDSLSFVHYSNTEKINHVVNLVGWDDEFVTNTGQGVWIAQNSLGLKSGDAGYFYIPYQDKSVLQYNAVWPEWCEYPESMKIIYYDTLGQTSTYGFEDTVCYALVEFTAPGEGMLKTIGTWCTMENSIIQATIYKSFDKEHKQLDMAIGQSENETCRFEGYYHLELVKPVKFTKGELFYVKVKYSTPTDTCRIPVERYVKQYAYPDLVSDKCWINPDENSWPETWYLCGKSTDYPALQFDLCIKAYFYNE